MQLDTKLLSLKSFDTFNDAVFQTSLFSQKCHVVRSLFYLLFTVFPPWRTRSHDQVTLIKAWVFFNRIIEYNRTDVITRLDSKQTFPKKSVDHK